MVAYALFVYVLCVSRASASPFNQSSGAVTDHCQSVRRRCYPSFIPQKPGRILQRIDGYVDPHQYAGELDVLSISTGSSNSTFDSDIYDHSTDQQLRDFPNRLVQQSSCGTPSRSDGAHSVYSELRRIIYGRRKYDHVTPFSERQTSLVVCSSESEVQMLLVDIQGTAWTVATIHSTILHRRHGGPAALNTSLGNTQPSHSAEVKNKVRESFLFGCWSLGVELFARRYSNIAVFHRF